MSSKKRLIIFDHDGTLIDVSKILCEGFVDVASRFSLRQPTYREVVSSIGHADQFAILFGCSEPEFLSSFLTYYYSNHLEHVRLFPKVSDSLCALKQRGYLLAVLSNKLRQAGVAELEACGIASYFSLTIYREDVTKPKPDPEGVRKLLDSLGVSPADAVLVGDTDVDIECARNAGIKSVAALWGFGSFANVVTNGKSNDPSQLPLVIHSLWPGDRI